MHPLISQRRAFDCAVCAAAMFAGVPYEDAFVAAVRISTRVTEGLTVAEIVRLLSRLGRRVRRVSWQAVDLDEDTGVLIVNYNRPKDHAGVHSHCVVLRRGTLIDPLDPSVWDADEYLKVKNARTGTLLMEKE